MKAAQSVHCASLPTPAGLAQAGAWLAVAAWSFSVVAPHLGHAGGIDSDAAIPQLMANASDMSAFHLYYWGQDRFGGWPFIVAWSLRHVTGIRWSPDALYGWMAAFLATAAWPISRLVSRGGAAMAAGLLLATFLNPGVRDHVLDLSQPYAWQVAALAWAWWLLLRLHGEILERQSLGRILALVAAATFASFLAVWTSTLSLLLLGVILVVELGWPWRDHARTVREVWMLVPPGLAWAGERLIWLIHEQYSESHHYWLNHTKVEIDHGFLLTDLLMQQQVLVSNPWWVTLPLAIMLSLALTWRARRVRADVAARLSAKVVVTLMTWAVAVLVVTSLISWARFNGYASRYQALIHLFATLAIVAGVVALVEQAAGERATRLLSFTSLALLGTTAACTCPPLVEPFRSQLEKVCRELDRRAGGDPLLGSYWGTYLFIDGTADRPLIPVVQEREPDRTQWNVSLLKTSGDVVVSHYQNDRNGPPTDPIPFIQEDDALLALTSPSWLGEGPFRFSLYRNMTPQARPGVTVTVSGKAHPGSRAFVALPGERIGSEAFRVDFPPLERGRVVFFFGRPKEGVSIPELSVEPIGPSDTMTTVRVRSPTMMLDFAAAHGPPVTGFRFRYSGQSDRWMGLRSVWLLTDGATPVPGAAPEPVGQAGP